MDNSVSPLPLADLGATGFAVWSELNEGRSLGATHSALVYNIARIMDRLDKLGAELEGKLVVSLRDGNEVPNPLLTEHRQQFLAVGRMLKDMGLLALPDSSDGSVVSELESFRSSVSRKWGVASEGA